MLKKETVMVAKKKAAAMIRESGIKLSAEEEEGIEVLDFGLSNLDKEGAQILTFFDTPRVSVRVVALFPHQTIPEHWHPPNDNDPGKEENIRVVEGTLFLYLQGEDNMNSGGIPEGRDDYYTARHEIVLKPGSQITLQPGTKHWFQAGSKGTVFYLFSSQDILDEFTDPKVSKKSN